MATRATAGSQDTRNGRSAGKAAKAADATSPATAASAGNAAPGATSVKVTDGTGPKSAKAKGATAPKSAKGKDGVGPKSAKAKGVTAPKSASPGKSLAERPRKLDRKSYDEELARLDVDLNRLQEWIRHAGLKIVVLFEGRDAAGKGGTIKTISASLNPRICRVVALGTPSDRQKTQWYFQRYVEHLPAAGEMVLFDRSWYNRAGVERVMGFCSEEEYREFLRSAPEFERMLQRSGITVIKYWFSVSDDEQERRFQARLDDPTKRWKLSPMDLQSRTRWVDYSKAKDEMFAHTDTKTTPWFVVQADDKRRARLNTIRHLLSMIPFGDVPQQRIKLPPRQSDVGYVRPPVTSQTFIPDHYG